jgi:hypothetical protein
VTKNGRVVKQVDVPASEVVLAAAAAPRRRARSKAAADNRAVATATQLARQQPTRERRKALAVSAASVRAEGWTKVRSVPVLSQILPELREVRGPLASGFLWLLLGWLIFHGEVGDARGKVKLVELGEKLNPAALTNAKSPSGAIGLSISGLPVRL